MQRLILDKGESAGAEGAPYEAADVQHQYSPHTYQQAPSVLDTDLGQWSGTPHVLFIWLTYNVSGFVNIKRQFVCTGVQEPIRAQ